MVRFSRQQMKAIAGRVQVARTHAWAQEMNHLARDIPSTELIVKVENKIKDAMRYGFTSKSNVHRFVELFLCSPPDIMDRIDVFGHLRSVLEDPDVPEAVKRQWLETFALELGGK